MVSRESDDFVIVMSFVNFFYSGVLHDNFIDIIILWKF